MTPRPLALLVLVLLTPLGGASDPLETVYKRCEAVTDGGIAHALCVGQVDGGAPGDASDACAAPAPQVPLEGAFQGWLAPSVDPEDNYALHVPASGLAFALTITSAPSSDAFAAPPRHRLAVYAPSGTTACAAPIEETVPGSTLRFVSSTQGVHTLRVVEDGVAGTGLPAPPGAQACHLMCLVMNKTGYAVSIVLD